MTESRPEIRKIHDGAELRRWYWLKSELVAYCKENGIPYSAGKFELLARIAHFMDTGEIPRPKRKKTTSKFDWGAEALTPETIITDSYKNTENMRSFMTEQIGARFRFNIAFMKWMKAHTGKPLSAAVNAWLEIEARQGKADFQTEIEDHNQYNQYLRDFFADNPTLTIDEARLCWEKKRLLPSEDGFHRYAKDDIKAIIKPF